MTGSARSLLFVGLGSIGQRHVRNLRTLAGETLRISAWRARREHRVLGDQMNVVLSQGLEERYGIECFDTLDAALDAQPDAVMICNPTSLHLEVARRVAERGIHIFLEKPLSHDMAGVDDLARLIERRNLVTLVGFQMRYHPCFRAVRDALASGVVGRPLLARLLIGSYLPSFHPWEDYREGYAARSDLGGGVVLTLIHEIDTAIALFGLPARVFALGGHWSPLAIDVDDVASSLLECSYRGHPVAVHVQQDYLENPPRRTWEIVGDAGRIEIDLEAPTMTVVDASGAVTRREFSGFSRKQLFEDEMRHFLACLDRTERPQISFSDAVASQRVAAAIRESIAERKVVGLT